MAPPVAELDFGPAIVDRCRQGDTAAWRSLYDAHFDFAWRTAVRLGLPEADSEDAAQEAFEVALRRLSQFREGRFSTWLYRIVANVVAARLRKLRVRRTLAPLLEPLFPHVPSVADRSEARLVLERVQTILQKLSREKREAFALYEIEGKTHEEIAESTGTKVETVRTRLFYARRDFQKLALEHGVAP